MNIHLFKQITLFLNKRKSNACCNLLFKFLSTIFSISNKYSTFNPYKASSEKKCFKYYNRPVLIGTFDSFELVIKQRKRYCLRTIVKTISLLELLLLHH